MRPEDLDRAFGATPEAFSDRMNQTLLTLKEEREMKRTAFRTVLVIAVISVLLFSTAIALVSQGLEWYYSNRFTAYQQYEPEKHAAIMANLETEVPQKPVTDPDIHLAITETSWLPEQNTLIVSLTARAADPAAYELHPMFDLDTDGAYVGKENLPLYADEEEARSEHWLWTENGFGPVAEMVSPGKQLLLFEADAVYLGEHHLIGDMSSMDVYTADDGSIHTVLEVRMGEYFDPDTAASIAQQIAANPGNADFLIQHLAAIEQVQKILADDADGVITLRIPYTVTPFSEDDTQLYQGGRTGNVYFDVKLK